MCYLAPLKIDQGRTRRYGQHRDPEVPLTHARRADQSWNVTPTSWVQQEGGKCSWHTNRKRLKPPHNGVSCTSPSPLHDSSLHTLSALSLISLSSTSHPDPPTTTTTPSNSSYPCSYSSRHILVYSLQTPPHPHI